MMSETISNKETPPIETIGLEDEDDAEYSNLLQSLDEVDVTGSDDDMMDLQTPNIAATAQSNPPLVPSSSSAPKSSPATTTVNAAPLKSSLDESLSQPKQESSTFPHESAVHHDLPLHMAENDDDDSVKSDQGNSMKNSACAPTVEQVVSLDQLKHGAATALEMFGWGFSKVNDAADKAATKIKNNEKFKEIVHNMQPGLEKLKGDAAVAGEKIKVTSTNLYQQAKPGIDEFAKSAERNLKSLTENLFGGTNGSAGSNNQGGTNGSAGSNNQGGMNSSAGSNNQGGMNGSAGSNNIGEN